MSNQSEDEEGFQNLLRYVRKKYTEGIYKITVAYMDHNLELQTFDTDGADLKMVMDELVRRAQ